jgi:hypothetical protein
MLQYVPRLNVDQQAQCSFAVVEGEEWDQRTGGQKKRARGILTSRYVLQISVGTVNVLRAQGSFSLAAHRGPDCCDGPAERIRACRSSCEISRTELPDRANMGGWSSRGEDGVCLVQQ